ncbi:MAG: ShlB/FhaC/HecB family hemolysin secretion/activation protein [Pseudomonadota bacterium]
MSQIWKTNKKSMNLIKLLGILTVILLLAQSETFPVRAGETEQVTFPIHSFHIGGNTVLGKERLTQAVKNFAGEGKTAEDVEAARDSLEQLYHESGYPTVLVNIPEQTVEDGTVKLEVIESRIKRVRVVGNKYFTMEKIKQDLAGLQPGKILFLPQIQQELSRINQNPDLKVSPVLVPGRELGTIDVELKVEDKLPLHGSLEVNNRSTHTTTNTRLNGLIRYDNLWQKGHSISAQFQTSPEKTDEVKVFSTSYSMPVPWNKDHLLIGYVVYSDSETASGEGFNVIGKGNILGLRYMVPLPSMGRYDHSLTAGFDWKDFEEDTQGAVTPITYVPMTLGYAASFPNKTGVTQFSADINLLLRGMLGNDMDEFQNKRFGATGNYLYMTAGLERRQKLPENFSLFVKIDGQVTDQPLVNNEQYSAGGVGSVRGYMESEVLADNAFHGTIELYAPSLFKTYPTMPYLFYDYAWLFTKEPLAGQSDSSFIHGLGIGLQGSWKDHIDYKLDWGMALEDTDDTQSGDLQLYFKCNYRF